MYEILASFAQTGGMIYFILLFAGVLTYALWPKNQETFDQAARSPLNDEGPIND
ncbi:MAG: CcoQ/FixQ family Cbb3-type cytochrome c oxidase assembly chaperone [Ponticaulis sp.]|nr:CcoQ/FixQ family Cbb3-type cytochrome c oxidase assembly chaperone [Ponticaulis sp.]